MRREMVLSRNIDKGTENMFKVMNKEMMRRINNTGIEKGYNKLICEKFLETLPDVTFPIIRSIPTDNFPQFMGQNFEEIVRCMVGLNEQGQFVWLDMTKTQHDSLPTR